MTKAHKISVIITTFGEMRTICQAIESVLPQLLAEDELFVISPDKDMGEVIEKYGKKDKNIYWIHDEGKGKPAALNLGLKKAKGDVLVLTDGDVFIGKKSLSFLTALFENMQIGAVSGHPVSREKKNYMLGYWSHLLTDVAHKIRLERDAGGKFLECSGYLYAIRGGLVKNIPEDCLSEDAVISHMVANKNMKIGYAPEAVVYVKYPRNYGDWLKQKVRSSGGYTQTYVTKSLYKMRTPVYEFLSGPKIIFQYPENFKEVWWTILLFLARIHLWILVVIKLHLLQQSLPKLWKRVESTK